MLGHDTTWYWLRIGLIVVVGAAFSATSFSVARVLENQRIASELEITTADRLTAIQRALDAQQLLLQAVAALRRTVGDSDRQSFHDFVDPLLSSESALQAIGWAPLVPAAARDAVEQAAAAEGMAGFRITERGPSGRLVTAGQRDTYTPVLYYQPIDGNESVGGFDLFSEPVRRRALDTARDTGEMASTGRLNLIQERVARVGFLSALAVYRPGAPQGTIADRRQALIGFVTEVFWIDDLIESGLANLQPAGVDMQFFDAAEGPDAQPLYEHISRPQLVGQRSRDNASNTLMHHGRLTSGGREWRVVSLPTQTFIAARQGLLPWVLLAIGLLATATALSVQWSAERRASRLRDANARLENSEARTRNVVESMPALLAAFDPQGLVVAWNNEGERVTGYSPAEIVGRSASILFADQPGSRQAEANLRGPDYRDAEWTLVAKDGSLREVAWTKLSDTIPIPGWDSWQVGIDVTARNRSSRERHEIQKQSLQSQKLESLGLLAGGIAHDFNNLLTAILGNASLALESIAEPQARAPIEGVVRASQRAALLTQQLLAYTGKGTFEKRPIDLSEHVREIGSLLLAAVSKKVSLHFELGADLPAVDADPAQIQQLVMNLVINGAEASGEGPGTVRVSTRTQLIDEHDTRWIDSGIDLPSGVYLRLEVQDDGQGMNQETQEKIFDPFFSTKFTGRGLGLSAAMGIVHGHGGRMRVQSTLGSGAVFTVLLPTCDKPAVQPLQSGGASLAGHGVILVVDDEPMILELAEQALTGFGYHVITAADGLEAIDIVRARGAEIDCVLLDLTMPKMDGEETFRALHDLRPDLLTILCSGYTETAVTERVGKGIAGFLQKPYTTVALGAKVRDVLHRRIVGSLAEYGR